MTYLKPPAITRRVVNPLVARLTPGNIETLTVVGRRSGRPQHVPVLPVVVDGSEYLVAPYGDTQWSRNLRAAGVGELKHHNRHRFVGAQEVPVIERPPIIAAYRQAARGVEGCFTKLPDPRDHPVFRLAPLEEPRS